MAGTPNVGTGLLNSADANFDRGNCTFDRRQIFNATAVYQVPKFENKITNIVASGWQLAGIFRAASGLPLAIITGTDASLTGQCNGPITGCVERPNQVLGDVYTKQGVQYLNSLAFAQPATGAYGNMSPGSVIAPGFTEIDLALSRTFAIHERFRLNVRGEGFQPAELVPSGLPRGIHYLRGCCLYRPERRHSRDVRKDYQRDGSENRAVIDEDPVLVSSELFLPVCSRHPRA